MSIFTIPGKFSFSQAARIWKTHWPFLPLSSQGKSRLRVEFPCLKPATENRGIYLVGTIKCLQEKETQSINPLKQIKIKIPLSSDTFVITLDRISLRKRIGLLEKEPLFNLQDALKKISKKDLLEESLPTSFSSKEKETLIDLVIDALFNSTLVASYEDTRTITMFLITVLRNKKEFLAARYKGALNKFCILLLGKLPSDIAPYEKIILSILSCIEKNSSFFKSIISMEIEKFIQLTDRIKTIIEPKVNGWQSITDIINKWKNSFSLEESTNIVIAILVVLAELESSVLSKETIGSITEFKITRLIDLCFEIMQYCEINSLFIDRRVFLIGIGILSISMNKTKKHILPLLGKISKENDSLATLSTSDIETYIKRIDE